MSQRICLLTGHPECLSKECAEGREPCRRSHARILAEPYLDRNAQAKRQPRNLFRLLQSTGAIETFRAPRSWLRRLWLALT